MQKSGRRSQAKSPKDFFVGWVYRKHLLSMWLDYHGKSILSKSAKTKSHARAFGIIVDARASLGSIVNSLVSSRSCIVECGSMCCYFPAGRGLGVYLGEDEADNIVSALRELGLDERDYVKKSLSRDGKIAHYLRLDNTRRVPKKLLASAPEMLSGEKLWIDGKSLACSFLEKDNSCMLYECRPRSCRDFICKTADMVNSLFCMGVIPPSYLDGKNISELNALADRCMHVFSDEGMRELDSKITVAFMDMVRAYLGSGKNLERRINEVIRLSSEYSKRRDEILEISSG